LRKNTITGTVIIAVLAVCCCLYQYKNAEKKDSSAGELLTVKESTVSKPEFTDTDKTTERSEVTVTEVNNKIPEEKKDYYYSCPAFNDNLKLQDGYYFIEGVLKNTDLENKINEDIRQATDRLRENYSEKYIDSLYNGKVYISGIDDKSEAQGVGVQVICRNGMLSVLLAYACPEKLIFFGTCDFSRLDESRNLVIEHAETLNYDLVTGKRIERFSELLEEGKDWKSSLSRAASYLSEDNSEISYESEPELYTIDYILYEAENGYRVVKYFSESLNLNEASDFRVSGYNDMSSAAMLSRDEEYPLYGKTTFVTCENCGASYNYYSVTGSRFFDDELVSRRNQEVMDFSRSNPHDCSSKMSFSPSGESFCTPEEYYYRKKMNLWSWNDREGDWRYYYDPYTFEKLTADDIFGENWREYISGNNDCSEFSELNPDLIGEFYYSEDGTVITSGLHFSDDQHTNVYLDIPVSQMPDVYFKPPEGYK